LQVGAAGLLDVGARVALVGCDGCPAALVRLPVGDGVADRVADAPPESTGAPDGPAVGPDTVVLPLGTAPEDVGCPGMVVALDPKPVAGNAPAARK
jgi:hypothetical protein